MFKGYITYFCIFWYTAGLILISNWHFKNLEIFRGLERSIFLNSMTFSGFSWPYQTWVTWARLRLRHHYCHEHGWRLHNKKNKPLAVLNFMQSKTRKSRHISSSSHQSVKQSTWWHSLRLDANLFWSDIFSWHSLVTSDQNRHTCMHRGSVIYRFTEKRVAIC